jgi:hypothetical protein
MNSQVVLRRLLKVVARNNKVNLVDVERVFKASFEFQAMVMKTKCDKEKLEFPSVRVPYWGLFHCTDYTRKRLTRLNKKNDTDSDHRHLDRETDEAIP